MKKDRAHLDSKPLAGRRVAVTRPSHQARALIQGLSELGAEPLASPTIQIVDPPDPGPLRRAIEALARYDWVVFTSANGVERFWRALEAQGRQGLPVGTLVAAIGPATASALEERNARPQVVPEEYVAEGVADALIAFGGLVGRRVLLPRAAGARKVLPQRLIAAGAEVDEVVTYESSADREGIATLREALRRGDVDMITFTAASTVRHFVAEAGNELSGAKVAVIGPITARAARSVGLSVDVVAQEYTVDGLLHAIGEFYRAKEE